jgi:hypothetical protein
MYIYIYIYIYIGVETPIQPRCVPEWGGGIALLFHDHGTRRGWVISRTPQSCFTPGKDPVPIVQEAEWAPDPVWTGAENLGSTRIRSPDRPARSQSLYRLSYPAHRSGPEGSRKLRFPDYMTTAQDGGKVVSLTHRLPLPPGNAPGTHFC